MSRWSDVVIVQTGGGNHAEHLQKCSVCEGWSKEGLGLCYGHFIENVDGVLSKATDFCPYGVPKKSS